MLKRILKFCNDNHWWIIAGTLVMVMTFWAFGCQSTTASIMNPEKKVCRSELINELNYFVGLAKSREEDLDRQDAAKQALIDAARLVSQTGTINPAGLLNIAATIGAIGFGLNRNQKVKAVLAAASKNGNS